MQETLYQTVDAGDSLSDSGCRRLSIRQGMQETLLQTVDAGDSPSDSGCRSLSFRQRKQETLYQTADAEVSHQLSKGETPALQTADAGVYLSDS